jgi:hypothetical protein
MKERQFQTSKSKQVKMSQEFIQSNSSEFPISELSEVNFAERKIEAVNPLNPETAVKSKQRKPRKMSQIVAQEVAPVAKKLSIKMKKMMMSEIPATTKKIEMDLPQSDIGSVNQQANQMSQEFNQYGSIEMNWFNAVGEESVVAEEIPCLCCAVPEVKKIITIRPRVKKSKVSVPPAPAREEVPVQVVQDVAELLAEMVQSAYEEAQKQEKIGETVARLMAEKKAKAKASREKTKAKKLALAQVAQVAQVADSEDEEGEGKDEGEYERSTAKRPIQKEKEGRVLKDKMTAVEKELKKELKLLKTPLAELTKKAKTTEEIEEKREEFIQEKKSAISRVHHKIAEKFQTSVVVARRSEAGKGEKKTLSGDARGGVHLKDATVEKLFWANCGRVLPHFVSDFTTFSDAKKRYAEILKNASIEEKPTEPEKAKQARKDLAQIFHRASEALVSDRCVLFDYECSEASDAYIPEGRRKVLATHLSLQGIYVVRRTEKTLVLRNSRDELIEIGNTNEVMSERDLIFHADAGVDKVGKGVLKKICGVSERALATQGKAYQEGEDKVEECD